MPEPNLRRYQQPLARRLKERVKRWLCGRLHVPFYAHGLPPCLVERIPIERPLTIVDVGAHAGEFTESIERYAGLQRALLIEPLPERAAALRLKFPEPVATVVQCAAAAQEGTVDFQEYEADCTSSLLTMTPIESGLQQTLMTGQVRRQHTVQTRRLDDLCKAAGIDSVDLLKIDAQGAELDVLDGARAMLRRTRFVWIEVSFRPLYAKSCVFSQVFDLLHAGGHRLVDLDPVFRSASGELLQSDALFERLPS